MADFYSEQLRLHTLKVNIAKLKRDGKHFQVETDQLLPCEERIDAFWADVQTIENNTDIRLVVYEYQTAIGKEKNTPVRKNAQAGDSPFQSNSAGEGAPPVAAGDNQTHPSGKRRLDDSTASQNSDHPDEENFQTVQSKKSKKLTNSVNLDNVSDMEVSDTAPKAKKPGFPQSKLFRPIPGPCFSIPLKELHLLPIPKLKVNTLA